MILARATNRLMDACITGWTDGWVDRWIDGWIEGWMKDVYMPASCRPGFHRKRLFSIIGNNCFK